MVKVIPLELLEIRTFALWNAVCSSLQKDPHGLPIHIDACKLKS